MKYNGIQTTVVTPFELTPWLLGSCENIHEAKELLLNINLMARPFGETVPNAHLHWIIFDQ